MALANDPGLANRLPAGRRAASLRRAEPLFVIPQGAVDTWNPDDGEVVTLFDGDLPLLHRPGEALGAPQPKQATVRSRFWKTSIVASCLLHMAVAMAFVQFATDEVQIEGGARVQVALSGNAQEDQLSAGDGPDAPDPAATSVTLVTMLDARPVETVSAAIVAVETVTPVDPSDAVETADPVDNLSPVVSETTEPVRSDAERQTAVKTAPLEPIQPDRVEQSASSVPAQPVTEIDPVPQVAASPYPEILTAERLAPVSEQRLAPLASERPAETFAQLVEALPTEPIQETTAEPLVEVVQPEPADLVAMDAPVLEKPVVEKGEPKPAKKHETKTAKPAKHKSAKTKAESKENPKADKPAKAAPAKAGSKGSNQSDARRGEADGSANGRSTAKSTGAARNSAAGNASASNYPGKVVSKLRRALRYPASARSQKLRGEVEVAFTVSAGGGIGGVRVVRSSGSPILDKAAVDTVRRAAPFPAIPSDAGRSSWPFSVPLAFTR